MNEEHMARVAAGRKAARRGRRDTGGELDVVKQGEKLGYDVIDRRRQEAAGIATGIDVVWQHPQADLVVQNKRQQTTPKEPKPALRVYAAEGFEELQLAGYKAGCIRVLRHYEARGAGRPPRIRAILDWDELVQLYQLACPADPNRLEDVATFMRAHWRHAERDGSHQ